MWLLSPGQPSVTSRLAAGTLHGAVLSFSAELPFHLPAVQHRWLAYVLKMNFKIVKRICLHVMESSFNINIYIYFWSRVCMQRSRQTSQFAWQNVTAGWIGWALGCFVGTQTSPVCSVDLLLSVMCQSERAPGGGSVSYKSILRVPLRGTPKRWSIIWWLMSWLAL